MKTFIFGSFLILAGVVQIAAGIDSRIVDGVPQLALSRVNGATAWSQTEQNALTSSFSKFSATSSVTIEIITHTAFEITLSTSGLKFKNYTEYLDCLNSQGAMKDKIDDTKPSEKRKSDSSISYLSSENDKRDPGNSK